MGAGTNATPADITFNPKHLRFIELDAAQIPRVLKDVTLAAINTTYASAIGLSPDKNALVHETAQSPYANLIVVRDVDAHVKKLLEFKKAYQSPEVRAEAKKLFGGAAIPAWRTALSLRGAK